MRILILSQFYFPETGATSNRIHSLAKVFKEQGHEVMVVAEKPNHPEGVFHKGFEKGLFIRGVHDGIDVTWCWVLASQKKGFLSRISFYVTYMLSSIFAVYRLKGSFDAVIASSPPLFVGVSGLIASWLKKAKFVFDVRDLWPDLAVSMGELKNRHAIRLAESLELFLYRKADTITTVTDSFKKSIIAKGIDGSKVTIVSNGTDPELFRSLKSKTTLRIELSLPDHFIVSYIGNIGIVQGLDHIIKSALFYSKSGSGKISFLFVGDGPRKKDLERDVMSLGLRNVIFRDRVPSEVASEYMNASDALLVPLANDPICEKFIPSKLFDSMAASKPVLLSVPGESREILMESEAGIFYPPEDDKALVSAIDLLNSDPDLCREMSRNGCRYVMQKYSRRAQALKMLDILNGI